METLIKFLLVCAFAGMCWHLLGRLFDHLQDFFSIILSWIILGVFFGILVAGMMICAEWFGICDSYRIAGIHPFWIGFIPGCILQIILWICGRL